MRHALESIPRVFHLASCIPLLILVMITTADVFARYVFRSSVPDTAEISGMLLGVCISLSLAFTTLKGEQVRFDLLVNMLSPRARAVADVISYFLTAIVFALIAWQTVQRVNYSFEAGEYIGAMELPIWPAKAVFALGCLLTAVVLTGLLVSALRWLLNHRHASRNLQGRT